MGAARARTDDGFTLVELMVVVLIIAILIAIGLPTFLGARARAQDGAAKTLTRQGLSAQLVHYGNAQEFTSDNTELEAIEPDVTWGTVTAKDKGVIATVTGPGNNTTILRSQSAAGTTFCIGRVADGSSAGTYYTTGCAGTEDITTVTGWPSDIDAGW